MISSGYFPLNWFLLWDPYFIGLPKVSHHFTDCISKNVFDYVLNTLIYSVVLHWLCQQNVIRKPDPIILRKNGLTIFQLHFLLVNTPQMNIFKMNMSSFRWVLLKCHRVLVMQGSLRGMRGGRHAHFIQDIDSCCRLELSELPG